MATVMSHRAASSKSKNRKNKKKSPNQAALAAARKPLHPIAEALDKVKESAKAKFDETVELAMVLNVDPRKANQTVRGAVQLPKGSGKAVSRGGSCSRIEVVAALRGQGC